MSIKIHGVKYLLAYVVIRRGKQADEQWNHTGFHKFSRLARCASSDVGERPSGLELVLWKFVIRHEIVNEAWKDARVENFLDWRLLN